MKRFYYCVRIADPSDHFGYTWVAEFHLGGGYDWRYGHSRLEASVKAFLASVRFFIWRKVAQQKVKKSP